MATYLYYVTSGSATASTDRALIGAGVVTTGLVAINPTHLAYGFYSVDTSGQLRVVGSVGVSSIVATSMTAFISGQATALGVTGAITASVVATTVTASQNGVTWGVSASALTANAIQSGTWIVTAQSSAITASAICYQGAGAWGVSGTVSVNAASILGITGSVTASCNVFQVSNNSATAATDVGGVTYGRAVTGDISTLAAVGNTAYVMATYDASGRAFVAGSYRSSATYLNGVHHGLMMMGVVSADLRQMGDSRYLPLMMDLSGNLKITATAALPVSAASVFGISGSLSAVTASQNGVVWGVTASAVTATINPTALTAVVTGTSYVFQSGNTPWGVSGSALTASAICYQNGTVWGVTASAVTASIASGTVAIASGSIAAITSNAGSPVGVSVSSTATLIKAANTARKAILITNNGSLNVYLGHTTTVTTAGGTMGLLLAPSGAYADSGWGLYTGDIYGVCSATASANVSVSERT